MSVAVIVLAAGFSRRLGRPKQSIEINGEDLLRRSARVACEASIGQVFLVLNRQFELAQLERRNCTSVINNEASEGIASSIRVGIEAALSIQGLTGVLLMTCDQVAVTSGHLRNLCEEPSCTTASGYAGRVGVPAYFPSARIPDLLKLRGDAGARALLAGARVVRAEDLALDVDTEEDVARLRALVQDCDRIG